MNRIPVLTHDDCIVIRAQKHLIGLDAKWWTATRNGDLYGWCRFEDGNPKPVESVNRPDLFPDEATGRAAGWRPKFEKRRKLADGVEFIARDSYIDLAIDLWCQPFATRYRVALDAIASACCAGIISYNGRALRSSRHAREAIRLRLKKYGTVARYEHKLTLPADIGNELLAACRPFDEADGKYADMEAGTIYLSGYRKRSTNAGDKLVLYRIGEKEHEQARGRVKLEVALRKEKLDAHGMRAVELWYTQPDIQERLEKVLLYHWRRVMKKAPKAMTMLKERTEQKTDEQLFGFMLDRENTLSAVLRRMDALEREQARAAAEQARTAERLARLEAMHAEKNGLRIVK